MKTCIKCGFDVDAPIDANTDAKNVAKIDAKNDAPIDAMIDAKTDAKIDTKTDATIAEIEKKIKEQNLISEIISSAEESSSNWSKNIEHLNTGT